MKELKIEPNGWPCKFFECPIGLFLSEDTLCLRTEYGDDAFIIESGESFWGPAPQTKKSRAECVVQPCIAVWHKTESD